MYCAFEIRSDMNLSLSLYTEVQNLMRTGGGFAINLAWVNPEFYLSQEKMADFGEEKIKQAKAFKDFDCGLLNLR